MPDLKILLTADLNEAQTVANINNAIAKIQRKIVKLHLEVDTSALKNADVMIKGLGNRMADQQMKINRVVNQTSKLSGDGLKDYEKRVQQINAAISKSGQQSSATYKTDANGNIQSATIKYIDATGKMVTERMKWQTFINKTMTGKDPITGKKQFEYVQNSVFKSVGQTYVENTKQLRDQVSKIFSTAQQSSSRLLSNSGGIPANKAQEMATKYQKVMDVIKTANAQGRELNSDELQRITGRVKQLTTLENKYKDVAKAGNMKIGNISSSAFSGQNSANNIKSSVATSFNKANGTSINSKDLTITSDITKANGRFVELTARVKQADGSFKSVKLSASEASRTINQVGSSASQAAKSHGSFASSLKSSVQMMVGMGAVNKSLQFFSDGVNYVNQLNKSLTELSITLVQTQSQVAHYGQDFHDLGMEMGISTQEIANGAVEFARQGKTGEDMMNSMKQAAVYAKISNLDFATSANILTASVNSMGVTAEHATDVFSYMGDATATGADEIGKAMQKVGGSAGALNIPFEKVASWIATVSSRTRESAETIGNSIKSIIARVQSLKENGYDSDNPDGVDYNQVTKALDEVNIKAVDANGNFRNFGEVMDELGKKWGTLSGKQKAYISTTVAGSYQSSRFLNIMEGYPQSVELYENSLNNAGIAQEKFNLYQQGTEAQLTKMKNAWTGIFQSAFQTDGINSGIAVLTALGTTIDNVVKHVGAFPTIMAVAGIAVMAFSSTVRTSISQMSIGLVPGLVGLNTRIDAIKLSMKGATGALLAGRTAALAAATGFKALAVSFAPLAIITAITWGISKLTEAYQKNKQAAEERKAAEEKMIAAVTTQGEAFDEVISRYTELDEKRKDSALSADEEIEYQKALEEIADILPNVVKEIDSKGQKHLKSAEAIQKELGFAKELARIEKERRQGDFAKNLGGAVDTYTSTKETRDSKNKRIEELAQSEGAIKPDKNASRDSMEYKIYLAQEEEHLRNQQEDYQNLQKIRDLVSQNILDGLDFEIPDKTREEINALADDLEFKDLDPGKIEKFSTDVSTAIAAIKKEGVDKAEDSLFDLQRALSSVGKMDSYVGIIESLRELEDGTSGAEKAAVTYEETLKALNESYNTTTSTLESLNGLLEDNANGKKISADEVMKLVQKDASLVEMFKIENGVIHLNIDAINKKKNSSISAMKEEMKNKRDALYEDGRILLAKFGLFESEINGAGLVADSYDAINDKMYDKMYNANSIAEAQYWNEQGNKAKALVLQLDNLKKSAELAAAAASTVGTSTNSKEKKEKTAKEPIEQYESKRTKLDEINEQIEREESLLSRYPKNSAKYREELKNQIKLLNDKKREAHSQAETLRTTETSLKKQIAAMGDFNKLSDENKKKLNDLRQELDDVQSSIANMSSTWFDAQDNIDTKKWDIVQSKLGQYNDQLEINQGNLDMSQARMGSYNEDSKEYRKELNLQIGLMKNRQGVLHAEAEDIRKMLKDDDLTIERKAELTATLRGLTVEWWNLNGSIKSNVDAMKAQRETLADDAISAIKEAIQAQADAAQKAIEDQSKLLEDAHDKEMDRLDEEQKAFEDGINDKIRALKKLSDQRSYDQDLADKEAERLAILNKIDLLSMDNSEEAKAQVKELQKQLISSNRDIDNLKYDHDNEAQQQAYQDEIDSSQKKLEIAKEEAQFKIEIWDEYSQNVIKTETGTYEELKKKLDDFKTKQETHYNDLLTDEQTFAKLKEAIVAGSVQDAINQFSTFKTWFSENLPAVGEVIQRNMTDKMQEFIDKLDEARSLESTIAAMKANSEAWYTASAEQRTTLAAENEKYASNIGATKDSSGNWVDSNGNALFTIDEQAIINAMKANSIAWATASKEEQARLSAQNKTYGAKLGATYNTQTGKWMKGNAPLYHAGGIVGGSGNSQTELVNKLFNAAPNEQVIMALQDELMVPSQNIAKNFIPNLTKFIQSIIPSIPTSGTVAATAAGGNITIEIGSVIGDEKGADLVTKKIIAGIKKLGGSF